MPTTIGPLTNVPLPGDPIESQWARDISQLVVDGAEGAAYTPGLTGIAIGTGGAAQNVASYAYVGGTVAGDRGILTAAGHITLGASGFSVAGACEIALPPGFATAIPGANPPVGIVTYGDQSVSGEFGGYAHFLASNSRLSLYYFGVSGTLIARALINATVPFTWAANDYIRWSATVPVVRT